MQKVGKGIGSGILAAVVVAALLGPAWPSYFRVGWRRAPDNVIGLIPPTVRVDVAKDQLTGAEWEIAMSYEEAKALDDVAKSVAQQRDDATAEKRAVEQRLSTARDLLNQSKRDGSTAVDVQKLGEDVSRLLKAHAAAAKRETQQSTELDRLQALRVKVMGTIQSVMAKLDPLKQQIATAQSQAHVVAADARIRDAAAVMEQINADIGEADKVEALLTELRQPPLTASDREIAANQWLSQIDRLLDHK